MNKLVYHYTTFECLEKIIESGFLKVSPWEKKNKIKRPALWLTKNPHWENTATKGYFNGSTREIKTLTFEEQSSLLGCIKITLPFCNSYCNWGLFKRVSKQSVQLNNGLEIAAKRQGSNPEEWYVSFKDIPTSKIIGIDYWDGNKWEDILVEEIKM
jgi:hypothetical protein